MTVPARRVEPFAVSAVGLGCMDLSHAYGTPPDAVAAAHTPIPAQFASAQAPAQRDHVVAIPGAHHRAPRGECDRRVGRAGLRNADGGRADIAGDAIREPRYTAATRAQVATETRPGEELA